MSISMRESAILSTLPPTSFKKFAELRLSELLSKRSQCYIITLEKTYQPDYFILESFISKAATAIQPNPRAINQKDIASLRLSLDGNAFNSSESK